MSRDRPNTGQLFQNSEHVTGRSHDAARSVPPTGTAPVATRTGPNLLTVSKDLPPPPCNPILLSEVCQTGLRYW